MHVVLVAPQIATNTGNIIRLCANTGSQLHLVEPLGFSMEDRLLRRAGLDYHDLTSVTVHATVGDALAGLDGARRFALRTQGAVRYDTIEFAPDDVLVFGAEQSGLSAAQLNELGQHTGLYLPMQPANRSLNLANAVAVVVYEAWRQIGFRGAAQRPAPAEGSGQTAEHLTATPFDP